MKNPLQRNNHTLLIAGIAVGAAAAGAAAYLFLSESGERFREQLTSHLANWFSRKEEQSSQHETPAYLQNKGARPKTDREQLQHGDILLHNQ
jgi:gas vesicle protein